MKYYTSDLHLSHTNIIKYENRPVTLEELFKKRIKNVTD
nr:MAG TPA: hypothetical protein [Caudoviricetes sp.]